MRDMVRLSRRLMLLLACVVVAFAASSVRGVAAASAEVRNPSGIAVIVGNKAYRHERVPEVSYAHRDAAAFRRYVVEVLGYDPENVIDLRDADQATLESVFGNDRSHEGKLWRYLDPEGGSDVVVFYSGHGVPGLKDKRSYLLPVNADPDTAEINGYPLDVLYKNLSKLTEVRSVRVFLDACFSGDSDRGMLVRSASPVFVKAELPKVMRKLTVVTAASDQQLASWDEKAKHGLFTHHLLDALYGKGDVDRDGKVTAAEAKRYLDRHMTRAARRTYGRHQRATLAGDETVVLASAVKGSFTARPVLGPGVAPVDSAEPVPDHAAGERALGLNRWVRLLVQRGLASLKFDAGPPDGLFGKKTRGAIKAWQAEKGFQATGHLTREQAEALKAVGQAAERQKPEAVRRARLAQEAEAQRQAELERQRREREAAARRAREMEPGRTFRDCEECPEMVVLPAGTFMMGSPPGEGGDDEGPRHEVRIGEPLAMGKYEITRWEFGEFTKKTGYQLGSGCWVWDSNRMKMDSAHSWRDPGFKQTDGDPVVCVSWEDAKAYVEWLSGRTGKGYRLMSEAEWEYAARAGTVGPFHFGRTISTDEANYDGRYTYGSGDKGVYRRRTVAVGSFPANDYGLHDAHGNAWEWVEDCWHDNYYRAPLDGSAWTSGVDCSKRVLRGGSWGNVPRNLRSASRLRLTAGSRINLSGFRVARTLTP